jgi:hypothetical protein
MRQKVVSVVLAAVIVTALAQARPARPPAVESKTSPGASYRLSKVFNGVITADDFSGPELDPKLWQVITLPEIKVYVEDGTLRLKGVSPEAKGRYTASGFGAFSLPAHSPRTKTLNAVMAAKVKFNHQWEQEGLASSPTFSFHFCGTGPDINASILHSFSRGRSRWTFGSGGDIGSTRQPTAPPSDDDALAAVDDHQWQTLFTIHRGSEATGYVLGPNDRWLQVGRPLNVWMLSKRIELEMLYGAPGFQVDVEWDDARLYPLPAEAPVRVAVTVSDSRDPRRAWPMTVKIVTADGQRVLAEKAGGPGGDLFDLTLPSDHVYPIAARIQLFHGTELDAEFPVQQTGVAGLYPGDIWHIDGIPARRSEAGGGSTTRPAGGARRQETAP